MSLTQELAKKSSSRSRWIWTLSIVVLLWIGYGIYSYWKSSTATETIVAAPTEYTIKKGDITLWLAASGTIQGNNTLSLGFETSGKITKIKKNIGDAVKEWEIIASIDDTNERVNLEKAKNALSQAIANYSIKVKPLSDLEKQQIEGTLAISQINYESTILWFEAEITTNEKTIADLEKKLSDYQDDLNALIGKDSNGPGSANEQDFMIQVSDAYQSIKQNLITIDEFLWVSSGRANLNDNYEYLIAAKNSQLKTTAASLWTELNNVQAPTSITLTQATIDSVLPDVSKMRLLASTMVDVMNATVADSNNLTSATIASYKTTFSNMYTTMSSKYSTIAKALQSDTDQRRSLDQQIAQAKADIEYQKKQIILKQKDIDQAKISNDQQLANSKIDYSLKLDPLTADEKQLAQLQLDSAKIAVQEQELALSKTQLKSPVDGTILTLVGHVGETAPSTFATVATKGYTYVQASISEDEVDQVKVGQEAVITPESLPEAAFEWDVYYVSTIGDTDNNGIVTYKVLVKYTSDDVRLRTAMNVGISFISKQVKDVMIAPIKAVFAYENTPHVTKKDGTLQQVMTWLSDGKQTEIISGVAVGDVILIKN